MATSSHLAGGEGRPPEDATETTMSESLLRLDAVKARTGLSRTALYVRIADGTFPRPVNLSKRLSAWPASEVDAWVQQQLATRDEHKDYEHA